MTLRPKTIAEQATMRQAGAILHRVLAAICPTLAPGQTLTAIDTAIERKIYAAGGQPAFKGYKGYRYASCLSVGTVVVHGQPSLYTLKAGDILGVDIGVRFDDFCADAAITLPIGPISAADRYLLKITQTALGRAIAEAKSGATVGDIGSAVERYVAPTGLGIVRDLAGHGIGRALQEPPTVVNYATGNSTRLVTGLALALEPMLSLGDGRVVWDRDDMAVKTADDTTAAQFETTVIVGAQKAEVLVSYPLEYQVG